MALGANRKAELRTFLMDALYSAKLVRDEEASQKAGDPRTAAIVITKIEEALLRLATLDPNFNLLKDD